MHQRRVCWISRMEAHQPQTKSQTVLKMRRQFRRGAAFPVCRVRISWFTLPSKHPFRKRTTRTQCTFDFIITLERILLYAISLPPPEQESLSGGQTHPCSDTSLQNQYEYFTQDFGRTYPPPVPSVGAAPVVSECTSLPAPPR